MVLLLWDDNMFDFLKSKLRKLKKDDVDKTSNNVEKHSHYKKDVRKYSFIDIYDVCMIFDVDDKSGCIHHIIKKLLVMGKRGHKTRARDLQDIRDSVERLCELYKDEK